MVAVWVWLGGSASYLVLAGSFSLDEIAAGLMVGGLGAAWHAAMLRDGARRFVFERQAWSAIGRAMLSCPRAILEVGIRLVQGFASDIAGERLMQVFHSGALDDPRDAGRRAVVVLATSFAPDSFALRLPLDRDIIVFHAFTRDRPSSDPRWPA